MTADMVIRALQRLGLGLAAAAALCSLAAAQSGTNPCYLVQCAAPLHFLSAASTNSTLVRGAPAALYSVVAVNTTAAIYYLKLYDKATAPTCGTDVPVATYPIPFGSASSGGGFVIGRGTAAGFNNGLGFCLTGGIADNDVANAAAGIAINLEVR